MTQRRALLQLALAMLVERCHRHLRQCHGAATSGGLWFTEAGRPGGRADERALDGECPSVEIHINPLQTEQFAFAAPGIQRHGPQR
jgi:hypothetical protein